MSNMRMDGAWLVVAAAMLWGTTGTAQAFAPDGTQPPVIGALRLLGGGFALLVLAWQQGSLQNPVHWSRPALILGSLGVAAYQVCFFAAVDRAGVAVGTIVGIGSAPIIAGLLDYVVNGTVLSRRWMVSTGLAVAGCGLLAASGGQVGADLLGILLALGAGLSYAIYTLASKRLLADSPPDAVMAVLFCAGAALLCPILIQADLGWLSQPRSLLVVLHLSLIATALSYRLFARGLRHVTAATAVTLSLAEPLTAGLLGVILLGERLTLPAWIGVALLFAGLYSLTIAPYRQRRARSAQTS